MDYKTKIERSKEKTLNAQSMVDTKNLLMLEDTRNDLEKAIINITAIIQKSKIDMNLPNEKPRFIIEKSRRLDRPIFVLLSTKKDKREAKGDLINLLPRLQSMGGELSKRTKQNF